MKAEPAGQFFCLMPDLFTLNLLHLSTRSRASRRLPSAPEKSPRGLGVRWDKGDGCHLGCSGSSPSVHDLHGTDFLGAIQPGKISPGLTYLYLEKEET